MHEAPPSGGPRHVLDERGLVVAAFVATLVLVAILVLLVALRCVVITGRLGLVALVVAILVGVLTLIIVLGGRCRRVLRLVGLGLGSVVGLLRVGGSVWLGGLGSLALGLVGLACLVGHRDV